MDDQHFWFIVGNTRSVANDDSDVFEAAIRDPDTSADVGRSEDEVAWESISYVRDEVYESVAGGPLPESSYVALPAVPAGLVWEEDDVEQRVPALAWL